MVNQAAASCHREDVFTFQMQYLFYFNVRWPTPMLTNSPTSSHACFVEKED
jgi:hypothetical protein